jgi:hypothetical protein
MTTMTHQSRSPRAAVTAVFLTLLGAPALAQAPAGAPTPDVTARSSVDHTAMWIADRVTYTIELTCRHGADVLLDDLSRDKLKLDGLEMVGSDTTRRADADDVVRYDFHYVLTTYRADAETLKVAPLSVRYYIRRPGQRVEDTAPAGSVQVPGAVVAFRSVLPEEEGWHEVRDARAAAGRPAILRMLQPIGIGLIVLSVVPVALLAIGLARRAGQRRLAVRHHRSKRQARQETRTVLEAVRAADATVAAERREAFGRLDGLVRQHVEDVSGVPASSLTPAEITAALEARPSRVPAETVSAILASCEVARYAPPELLPSVDAWRDALAGAERLLE